MKALYVYNPWSAAEVALISRVGKELENYIECVPFDKIPDLLRYLVRATPALIMAEDHLQGEHLVEEVDGSLVLTKVLYERMEEEDRKVHGLDTQRLAAFIDSEKHAAVEEYKLSLKEALEDGYTTAGSNL